MPVFDRPSVVKDSNEQSSLGLSPKIQPKVKPSLSPKTQPKLYKNSSPDSENLPLDIKDQDALPLDITNTTSNQQPASNTSTNSTLTTGTSAITTTKTNYQNYATLSNLKVDEFDVYSKKQADWVMNPALADVEKDMLWRLLSIVRETSILASCGLMKVKDLVTQFTGLGEKNFRTALEQYGKAVTEQVPFALTRIDDADKAVKAGIGIAKIFRHFPEYILKVAMKEDAFYLLLNNNYLDDLIQYDSTVSPHFEASSGKDFKAYFEMMHTDKTNPLSFYKDPLQGKVLSFHRFEAQALKKLEVNYKDTTKTKPLTLVLHSAFDHNGAIVRDNTLTQVITNPRMNTLMVEGKESLDQIKSEIDPIATKYGQNNLIDQVMFVGHGQSFKMEMAGTLEEGKDGKIERKKDNLDVRDNKTKTDDLFLEVLKHVGNKSDKTKQPHNRALFNACLTNSIKFDDKFTATTDADKKKEVSQYVQNHQGLTPYLNDKAASMGKDLKVIGANGSFSSTNKLNARDGLDIIFSWDPVITASKLEYIRKGKNPTGALRAVLELWPTDQTRAVASMRARIAESVTEWEGVVIKTCYEMILDRYLNDPDKIRILGDLADEYQALQYESQCKYSSLKDAISETADSLQILKALKKSDEWNANAFIPLVLLSAWMVCDKNDASIKSSFLDILSNKFTCQSAVKFVAIKFLEDQGLLADLLNLNNDGSFMLAAIGAANASSVNPLCKNFLISHIQANGGFDPKLNLSNRLGGLTTQDQLLVNIGKGNPVVTAADANVSLDGVSNTEFVKSITGTGYVLSNGLPAYDSSAMTKQVGTLKTSQPLRVFGTVKDMWVFEFVRNGKAQTCFSKKAGILVSGQ